ncbi:MAG: carbohydrate ABC transporter substrate-binding protein [Kosmotoga sp.]|uniref:ABC transporter substrate-binding protein n=1 Tax=Kosmotoga sp. TaxID=1955248 RepID=UPI0025BD5F53|nr:ABC transporter substrate-binding protein [Kosmotoga sp.]MCD6160299.1 carbohydrate ABC transporter substrate-binding protein [Kosmotoga sp.]
MRKLLVLMVILLTVLTFAKITVIVPWSGAELDKFLPVISAFQEKTGIEVEYKTYRAEDLANILPAQFAAKKAPGDVIFMWTSFLAKNTANVVELSDVVLPSNYLSGALDNVTFNGKIYGFAYTAKVKPGFWYRKSFFEKYGLTPPKTWDEFVLLLKYLKQIPGLKAPIASGDGVGWPLSDITEHFLITFGGPELQKDLIEGNISWKSYTVRKAMDKLTFLLKQGFFSEPIEWTTVLKQWWNGEYGLYFMGSWITGMVDDPNDLGVFSLPGNQGMVFGIDYAFVLKLSKKIQEAKKFVAFLASAEGQTVQVAQGGHIATVLGVPEMAYPTVDREVAKLLIGVQSLNDLDDSIGGLWQPAFWDQLKLLWVRPERLDDVLETLEEKMPK